MSQLVVRENEMSLSREKIELIKQTVAKGATDLELDLFFHACKRTGLDPLMKQIYAIKRWNSQERRETMTFQTGIDGYRLIADRTGCYAGSSDAEYTLNDDGFPGVAKVTVTKLVGGVPCQFTASARWDEYVQKTKEGNPTSMWQKMPFLMLGKCAEALALRKAFPAELSGLYTHEEMQQADEQKPAFVDNKMLAAKKIAELRIEGVTVEQDGASAGASNDPPKANHQQASDAAPFNPEVCPPAGLQVVDDVTWQNFCEYVGDDPDRTKVGKKVKAKMSVGELSLLPPKGRKAVMLSIQDEAKRQGIPFSEWVKE